MTWRLYRHFKGNLYLGLGRFLDSENKHAFEAYICLYENDLAQEWIRPFEMFHGKNSDGIQRFSPIGRVRVAYPEDEAQILIQLWSNSQQDTSLANFLDQYKHSTQSLQGTRFLLETQNGELIGSVIAIRVRRGVIRLEELDIQKSFRNEGWDTLLARAVTVINRDESRQ